MENIPNKIYLQIDADGETPDNFKGLEVTWCVDKIYDNDIEYLNKENLTEILDDELLRATLGGWKHTAGISTEIKKRL